MAHFERFKTFEDMKAYALKLTADIEADSLIIDGTIYTDNGGTSFRPSVTIWITAGDKAGASVLRWYAYADEPDGVDFYKRTHAKNAGDALAYTIKVAIELRNTEALKAAPEGWQEVEAGPEGTSLEDGPMVSPQDIAAMPKAPLRYKVTLVWAGKIVLDGLMTANLAWETIRSHLRDNFVLRGSAEANYPPFSAVHSMATGQAMTGGYKDVTGEAMWCIEAL